jgi:hypothetical protein
MNFAPTCKRLHTTPLNCASRCTSSTLRAQGWVQAEPAEKKGAPKRAQVSGGTKFRAKFRTKVQKQPVQQDKPNLVANLQRPKPVVCIAFREMSAVDEIPCIRSLNSSAFDALSRAVS